LLSYRLPHLRKHYSNPNDVSSKCTVDYRVVPPDTNADGFSEKLLYLPHTYQANKLPLSTPLCFKSNICRPKDHSDDKLWLCSFNTNKKLEPLSFTMWMNILRRLPFAKLVLLSPRDDGHTKKSLLNQAAFHGIAAHRFVFIPSVRYLINSKARLDGLNLLILSCPGKTIWLGFQLAISY
jgi:predicted O-linked N-acetylglucosamine transferase (SPINDLY family)